MHSKNSLRENYLYSLIYKIATVVIPIAITYQVSRALGADGVGKVSFVNSIASYFIMFATMGITLHGSRTISYYQEDKKQRSIVFWEIKLIQFFTSFIALLSYIVLAYVKGDLIYYIYTFAILAVAFDITWVYQGMEDFKSIVIRNLIIKIAYCILVIVLIRNEDDVALYALLTVASTFIGNVSLWITANKYIEIPDIHCLHPTNQIMPIFSLFIPTIATEIYAVFDKSFLGIMTVGNIQNGYYQQANVIVNAAISIVTVIGSVMMPRIGFYFKKGYDEQIKELVYKGLKLVTLFSLPISFGMVATAHILVPWFLGENFDGAIVLVQLLSLIIILIGFSNYIGIQYLVPTNRQKCLTISVVVGAVTNIVLDLFFIPKYYSMGAAIATVIAELAVVLVQFWFVRTSIHISIVLKNAIKPFWAAFVMFVVVSLLFNNAFPLISNVLLSVILGVFIYCIMLIVMQDELFIDIMHSVFNTINKTLRRKI